MPNVNCAVSAGTLVLSVDQQMPNESTELLITLGNSVGTCIKVDESQYNAAASVAACAPAFVSVIIFIHGFG
jgi:pyrroline-5-carboxylate reductase